ncbi:MAG: type II secretion system protein [Richelia sp.]|nr:type II secretion system protein [Richelia sp.]
MKFKQYKIPSKSRESGFTIIESLIALVVVSILMVAIAPVIVFSTATRVQSRRIELAIQAAKAYIEGVRTGTISVSDAAFEVDKDTYDDISKFPTPAVGNLTCATNNAYCAQPTTNLYCIDGDGGGCTTGSNKDFLIQAFRYSKASTDSTTGYLLGVRVYRSDGFTNDGNLEKAPATQGAVTSGLGEKKTPLVEINTEISSKTDSFNDLCKRLEDNTKTDTNSTCT